jgi:hypothetical protein
MPRYRVTLKRRSVEVFEADNPFMAALAARDRYGDEIEVSDVTPAVGRPAATSSRPARAVKKTAKKRRPLSPEARAKLAQNLAKARAVRAAKAKSAKKAAAGKSKRTVKKR